MFPFMINQGVKDCMNNVMDDENNDLTYITLQYNKDRMICEINRLHQCEEMTPSEPAQQLDCRRNINDIANVIDVINQKQRDLETDHASKSIGLLFSQLTAKLKSM